MVDRETFAQAALAGDCRQRAFNAALAGRCAECGYFDARLWEELAACEDAEVANAV